MSEGATDTDDPATSNEKQPLSDVMLAMDVVDTLRHQQLLVERELGADDREAKMKQRLREIYESQGIDVPDHIIEQGVAALEEGRFVYDPPESGLQTRLAELYINRASWGRPVLLVIGGLLAAVLAYVLLVSGPAKRAESELPGRLQSGYELLESQISGPVARERASALMSEGESALARGDRDAVEAVIGRMDNLREDVEREYELRIVARPGERSGVWRIPDANSSARNYYLIVEAVGAFGAVYDVPIVNEEDGKTYRVKRWGLRVDEAQFQSVAADKSDDGIIQANRVGEKQRGFLQAEYSIPTSGGTITRW